MLLRIWLKEILNTLSLGVLASHKILEIAILRALHNDRKKIHYLPYSSQESELVKTETTELVEFDQSTYFHFSDEDEHWVMYFSSITSSDKNLSVDVKKLPVYDDAIKFLENE